MIKNNDTPTVVILSLVAFVALTYSFMFLNPMNAEAFVDRTGGLEQGQAGYFWMGLIGTIYLALAIGNIFALLATPQECAVYYRVMVTLTALLFLRAIWTTMTQEGGGGISAPLVMQGLVWLGTLVVYTRSGQRIGSNINWM